MAPPLIGITCYRETAAWSVWHVPSVLAPAAYVDKVADAGGVGVLLPPRAGWPDADAERLLDCLDGLLLTGGVDVAPVRYDAEPHPSVQASRADRDDLELQLARLARERDLPTLGICRGMQVMAVAASGRLEQHLPDRFGNHEHAPSPGEYGDHPVEIEPGTRIQALLGDRLDSVPTYHHQAVTSCPGLVVSAYAPDGTPEALEDPGASFYLGVQWHPEVATDGRLFAGLVEAARRARVS